MPRRRSEHEPSAKIRQINEALVSRDTHTLRRLGKSKGGFLDDGIRRRVWPLLLHTEAAVAYAGSLDHRDMRQVDLDVNRSFVNYEFKDDAEKSLRQQQLSRVINATLAEHTHLHYYQVSH